MKKQIYFSLFLFLLSCGAEEKVESKLDIVVKGIANKNSNKKKKKKQ